MTDSRPTTPISFHRLLLFFYYIIYLHNASRQAPPGPHPREIQTTQKPKGKRLVRVLESIDQIIKNTITTNTKRQKTK